ncbi:ankyrin-1-like [Ptychodera flava]|uniref:ankyrin-1-like n=1 Tax=Ptychodera flava TaxID=63121 RepID=UPI003969ED51
MKYEIAPNSVRKPCKISTEILQHPPESLQPSDGERVETEVYNIGIEKGCFDRPPVVAMRSGQGSRRPNDRTRDTVVRSIDSDGNSVGLKSWKEVNIIKAEIPKSSVVTLVSKPKQYSFQLTNGDDLVVSCKNGDVEIDTTGTDDKDRKRAKITAQLMNVDEKIAVRARELVEENAGNVFALGTVLELQSDADISKPVAFELSLPSCGPLQSNSSETKSLTLLKDGGNDRWHDVTEEVAGIQCTERCLSFTTKLARGCTRFVVALADAGIEVEKTARKATGMARKNCKVVNFILLRHKENPKNLYVDCVVSDMCKERLEEMKKEDWRKNSSLPSSRDIDLPEGERVYLHVGGDQFKIDKGSEEYLTFYAERRCWAELTVSFDPSGDNYGDDRVQGYVIFTRTRNSDDDESVYCKLKFELPCPVKGKIPTSSPHPLDISFDLIEQKLLPSDIKSFGRKLLSDTDVEKIVYEDRHNTNEQIHQILQTWKKQKGNKALLVDLLSALENIGNKQLAETIQRAISAAQQSRMTQPDHAEPLFNAPMSSQVQNNAHPTSHQREIKQDYQQQQKQQQQQQKQQQPTVQPSMAFKGAKKPMKAVRRPPRGRGLPMSSAENSQNQLMVSCSMHSVFRGKENSLKND